MKINKEKLFQELDKLNKNQLIILLEDVFDDMAGNTQRRIFDKLINLTTERERTPEKLVVDIEIFYSKSMSGYYYAPFNMTSKNFSYIPEGTEEWFNEISEYLDSVSEIIMEKKYNIGLKCFELLFELIDKMESGEEIVFAHELGDWMLSAKSDYTEKYIVALSQEIKQTEDYVNLIIPMIKSDSYYSFSKQVYKKVKKHSSVVQLEAINNEIKSQSIRLK